MGGGAGLGWAGARWVRGWEGGGNSVLDRVDQGPRTHALGFAKIRVLHDENVSFLPLTNAILRQGAAPPGPPLRNEYFFLNVKNAEIHIGCRHLFWRGGEGYEPGPGHRGVLELEKAGLSGMGHASGPERSSRGSALTLPNSTPSLAEPFRTSPSGPGAAHAPTRAPSDLHSPKPIGWARVGLGVGRWGQGWAGLGWC